MIKLVFILLLSFNLFANDIATISALKGIAKIHRDNNTLEASLGSQLKQQDNILTKENAKLQIIFKDETVVNIGKNSEFSISEYLFEDNTPPIAKFSMLKGAMRTITGRIGKIAPQQFSVATRTATIGVRGTSFSVFVEDDGSSSIFCSYGSISVLIAGVSHIVNKGFYIAITPQGLAEVKEFSPQHFKEKKEQYFKVKEQRKDDKKVVQANFGSLDDLDLDISINDNMVPINTEISNNTQSAAQSDTSDLEAPTDNNNNNQTTGYGAYP